MQLRDVSGRFELVDYAGGNRGADFYINSGQRFLDGIETLKKAEARVFRLLQAGHVGLTFPYCRAIKEVWAASGSEYTRWQLTKKNMQDLRLAYANLPSSLDQGDPLYYSPIVLRAMPEISTLASLDLEGFLGYADVMAGDHFDYNGIVVMPPPTQQTMIEVFGLFYSQPLVNDDDKSFWSEVHPDLLVMAAMRSLEEFYRNRQGVNDWTLNITERTSMLGKDTVEEDIAECNQMRG